MIDELIDIEKRGKLHWVHWVVVAASLLLTFAAWYYTKSQNDDKIRVRFESEANQVIDLVQERMQKYEDALRSGTAAYHASTGGMSYQEWAKFSDALHIEKTYPGINGIGIIFYVPPEKRASFLANERKMRPDFKIHPQHDQNEYWPITYIEPVQANKQAVGLDMAHEANRFSAAKKARDSGQSQITAPIILVQDAQKTPGFLFYVPFYKKQGLNSEAERRKEFIGLVYAPFIMNKLIRGTLQNDKRLVNIAVSDGEHVLYDEHVEGAGDYDPNPIFMKKVTMEMYGRPWVFNIYSSESFRALTSNSQPLIILFGGLAIDSLLLALFILLSRSNKHAVDYAKRVTQTIEQARMSLKDAKDFQEVVIESIPDQIFVKDQNGKIIIANNALLDSYPEHMRSSVIGSDQSEYYDKSDSSTFRLADEQALEDGFVEYIEDVVTKDGLTKKLHVSKIGFENDKGEKFILGIARDETEREILIEKLASSNAELERFAYVASHDMQEPVRMVMNFSQIVSDEYKGAIDDEGREYLRIIVDSAKRIREMVDDLMEFSRVNTDMLELVPFDGNSVMQNVLENLFSLINSKSAEITYDKLPVLNGNPFQFMRLMQNLIVNAIKYQEPSNIPKIHVGVTELGNEWEISVSDNGLGIEEEFIEQIFQPFRRLHSWENIPGSGLGLSICNKIVQNHGGTIRVESAPGKGSTFILTFPKNKPNVEKAA